MLSDVSRDWRHKNIELHLCGRNTKIYKTNNLLGIMSLTTNVITSVMFKWDRSGIEEEYSDKNKRDRKRTENSLKFSERRSMIC